MAISETKILHGGILKIGDFVAIASGNTIDLGWFCGRGIGGTFQYYYYRQPSGNKYYYEVSKSNPNNWNHKKAIASPFSLKWINKSFLTGYHDNTNRIIKIEHPREFFTDAEELKYYEDSKQILEELNFLKQ